MPTATYWLRNKGLIARLVVWALIPVILTFIPIDLLNQGKTICLYTNLTGISCPGCGMSRAIISLTQFQFEEAWRYNHLVVVVAPLLFYLWVKWGYARLRELKVTAAD